jgi:hypothetical protein
VSIEIYLQLIRVIIQNSAYLACLAWLAWSEERRQGSDAFHLVVAYAGGVWLLSILVDRMALHQLPAIFMTCVVAYAIGYLWPKLFRQTNQNDSWKRSTRVLKTRTLLTG